MNKTQSSRRSTMRNLLRSSAQAPVQEFKAAEEDQSKQ